MLPERQKEESNANISVIYKRLPPDIEKHLENSFSRGLSRGGPDRKAAIFFRADDVGVPGKNFSRMMSLFAAKSVPLNLAVVPAWLTKTRWRALQGIATDHKGLWCWHQHGWRHANHELHGKKNEFGGSRSTQAIQTDLLRGKERLQGIMENRFTPIFTPPWNRCSQAALASLHHLGFQGFSGSPESLLTVPEGLKEFPVNVDLHTRKEDRPDSGWECLLKELRTSLESGCSGIMLHHQRMNGVAFSFLELLLQYVVDYYNVRPVHLGQLVQNQSEAENTIYDPILHEQRP